MRIGIYGGTFNPPHRGHMAAAVTAANVLELDRLLLIPAGIPPHKQMAQSSATQQQRLEMTQIMADRLGLKIPVQVLDLEMRREGKSYTSDTLRELKALYPEDELWLMMGTDMFLTFHLWHEPEVIASLAGLCAFGRTEQDGEELFAPQRAYLQERFNARIVTLTIPNLVNVSSSQIRQELSQGQENRWLDESVWGYILREDLYGMGKDLTKLTLEELRACSYSMVKAKRLPHIRGTEEEAALLARLYGADEQDARRAAILHDCTKYWNWEKQLSICEKYGMLIDRVERENPALLHAKSGAVVAREVFGMPEHICEAIRWHTTGKAGMSLLEKILYIADYAEPTRPYDWCHELKTVVEQDLDRGVCMGLEHSIRFNEASDKPIHPDGIAAWNWIQAEIQRKGE